MDPVKIKCIAICRETTICVLSCVKKMLNFPKSSLLVHAQRLSHCFNIITTKCSWLRCHLCVRYSLTSCDMRATPHQIFLFFLRGRKNGANDGKNGFLISLQPVASWKTFLLPSDISLYPVLLSVSGVSPEVRTDTRNCKYNQDTIEMAFHSSPQDALNNTHQYNN